MNDVEASLSLDRFERPRIKTSPERRAPDDWSLERPGASCHIGPVVSHPPADLDPHLRTVRLAQSRESRMQYLRSMMLGYAAIICLAVLSVATLYAAATRLPAIEQQLAEAARV
jgi:hypothetical protein